MAICITSIGHHNSPKRLIWKYTHYQWRALLFEEENQSIYSTKLFFNTTQTTPGPSQNMDYITFKGAELPLAMNALC